MSMALTRKQLQARIADESVKVIALSGKWGTGKSFMFDQIHKSATAPEVKKALYASLFGLSTIDQIKLKLMQSSV
jgi:pantothenate kinase-related protein Tda10